MATIFRVNHTGAVIRRTIQDPDTGAAVDVSTAGTRTLKLEKPNGQVLFKAASFTTDGTDGQLQYTTSEGDLDVQGLWRCQFYVEFASNQHFHTDMFKLQVGGNLS